MIEDAIDDGDIVVIKPQDTADNGEKVVALITSGVFPEGEATLKRLYREGDRVRLQPANSEMQPICVNPRYLQIRGQAVYQILPAQCNPPRSQVPRAQSHPRAQLAP